MTGPVVADVFGDGELAFAVARIQQTCWPDYNIRSFGYAYQIFPPVLQRQCFAKIADFTNQRQCSEQVQPGRGTVPGGDGILADVTFVWGCCLRSRVEGLLLPLIIDGQFKSN